ncbi:MAG: DEAD/DEAH box helicase [Phycisphaerae bacterium]
MIQLRPYQIACVAAVNAARRAGQTRQLVTLPCGTGKTIIIADLAVHSPGRALIVAHRYELLDQARDKLIAAGVPCDDIGVVRAERHEANRPYIVASVQTLSRRSRLERFGRDDFGTDFIDECHHSAAATYQRVIAYFQPELLLGLTATAFRSDGKGLAEIFGKHAVYAYGIREAIADHWLVMPRQWAIHTRTALDQVHTRAGEFVASELSACVNSTERNDLIVTQWDQCGGRDRPSVVFGCDVAHATALAKAFSGAGVRAAVVHGDTPEDERARILHGLTDGSVEVVCNCQIITEGINVPPLSCCVMARPTKSPVLYQQSIGRILRPFPGKADALIIDVADNTKRHKLATISQLLKTRTNDFEGRTLEEVEAREAAPPPTVARVTGWDAEEVSPFAPAAMANYVPSEWWHSGVATDRQLAVLTKFGIDLPAGYEPTKGECSYLIDREIERRNSRPPSPKMKYYLQHQSEWRDDLTFEDARRLIGRLKAGQYVGAA